MPINATISTAKANETVIRIIAGFVVLLTIATLATAWFGFPLYLTIDFFFRAFTRIKPPLALAAEFIKTNLGLSDKFIFAPPKKFAAAVGFLFSLATTILLLLHLNTAAIVVAAVLLVCSVLESVFAICVGCYFYDWFVAPIQNRLWKN